jgi:hypothetical protein
LYAAIANVGRGAKRNQQSISLGTTPLVAANILPPAMREFRKQRPDVRVQLFDADLPTLIQMVEAGKLSRRRHRHHSLIRDASVPQPKGCDEPIDQSGSALRLSHHQPPWQRTAAGSG